MPEEKLLRCAACTYQGPYSSWGKLCLKRANVIPIVGDEATLIICPACSTIRSPADPKIESFPDHN